MKKSKSKKDRLIIKVDPNDLVKIAADFIKRSENTKDHHGLSITKLKALTYLFTQDDRTVEIQWFLKRDKAGRIIQSPVACTGTIGHSFIKKNGRRG